MAQLVAAPQRQPRLGGIKGIVGEFVEESRLAADTTIAWEDSGCGLPKPTRAGCYDDIVVAADKEMDPIDQLGAIGPAFARYAGVECWIGGDSVGNTYQQQASTLLEQGEDREVEAVLWEWAEAAASPGTAATLVDAIAEADNFADRTYVGRPVLMLSRGDADRAVAAGVLTRKDGELVTGNGTPVLATGMVPDGEEGTVVAIGQPAVYASPIVARQAIAHAKNLSMAIAERVYAVGVDCNFRHAVTVTTP